MTKPIVCTALMTLYEEGRFQLITPLATFIPAFANVKVLQQDADQPTFARGGHGLFSTTQDYMRFALMLANGGELDGVRILGRKTLELMHANHIPAALLPWEIGGLTYPGLAYQAIVE